MMIKGQRSEWPLRELEFEVDEAPYVIPHETAYRHTKNTIAGLTQAMEDYRGRGGQNLAPAMRQAVLDGMQSLIEEWSAQMREYEARKIEGAVSGDT